MKKNQKRSAPEALDPEALEMRRGRRAGYSAALHGAIKKIQFTDRNNASIYINAYNEAYEKSATASPEERETRRGKYAGQQDVYKGYFRRTLFKPGTSPNYIQGYVKGYDSTGPRFCNSEKPQAKREGREAGFYGYKKRDFTDSDKSSVYIENYNEGYEKAYARFLALSFQDKEKRKGRRAGQQDARRGRVSTYFDANSPEYKEAYLEAYNLTKNRKMSTQDNSRYNSFGPQRAKPINACLKETNDPQGLNVSNNPGDIYGEERNLESNDSQQHISPCPGLPLFLMKSLENCLLNSPRDYNPSLSLQQGSAETITILEELYLHTDTLDKETTEAIIPFPELDASRFLNNEPANGSVDLKQDQFQTTEQFEEYQGSSRNLLFFSLGSSLSLQENKTTISDPTFKPNDYS